MIIHNLKLHIKKFLNFFLGDGRSFAFQPVKPVRMAQPGGCQRSNVKGRMSVGFTLLEILLVVAAIAILAAVVIRALNPAKQLADTRNAERSLDLNTIINAIYQYEIDHRGATPDTDENIDVQSNIPAGEYVYDENDPITDLNQDPREICRSDADEADCAANDLVNISGLTLTKRYTVAIPIDPSVNTTTNPYGTGYYIVMDSSNSNRITVIAPYTELEPTTSQEEPLTISL